MATKRKPSPSPSAIEAQRRYQDALAPMTSSAALGEAPTPAEFEALGRAWHNVLTVAGLEAVAAMKAPAVAA